MPHIDANSELEFLDGTYLVTEVDGNLLRLRNSNTGVYTIVHLGDISNRLVEPPTYPDIDVRALDEMAKVKNAGARKDVEKMAAHIREMVSGTPFTEDEGPRTEYDPTTTSLSQRIEAKSKELHRLGIPASRTSLLRKKRALEDGGLAGLLDGRKSRKQPPLAKLDEQVRAALDSVVKAQTQETTVTVRLLLQWMKEELKRENPAFDLSTLPSERTLYRYADFFMKGKHTTGDAKTRRSAAHTPNRPFTKTRPMHPGQQTQLDSTQLDLLVLDDQGLPQRPTLTILIDVATRKIIAATLRLDSTKGVDHVFLLAQALVLRRDRPGHESLWELTRLLLPGAQLPTEAEREQAELANGYIYPEMIVIDNGLDFRGATFEAGCLKFHIDIVYAAPYAPIDKAEVERMFDTIKRGLSSRLPGYVGGSVKERGASPESDSLLSLTVVAELLDEWITAVYHNTPHQGLRDPLHPQRVYTPNLDAQSNGKPLGPYSPAAHGQ